MAGGYGADAAVQGCADCGTFRLLHWHAVDVFVYFSHHLVTLPPPGWVAAGHCHGVPVRGPMSLEPCRVRGLFALAGTKHRHTGTASAVHEHWAC